jgi:hypothetical protein
MEEFGRFHPFNNCGWHFEKFNKSAGQAHLRDVLNPLLERLEPSLTLRADGQLEELAPTNLQPLLDTPLPESAPHDEVRLRVESAVTRFKRSRSSIDERRTAVRELADVLEFLRSEIKVSMMSADEGALFNLANNFAIRHHNRDQRGDYDKPVWLSWAFYIYLATIQAVIRLIDKQRRT